MYFYVHKLLDKQMARASPLPRYFFLQKIAHKQKNT